MKYKIVGLANIIIGVFATLQQIIQLFVVYPKLKSLYSNFNANLPIVTQLYPFISTFLILIFIFMIFMGIKLLTKPNQKLFKFGVMSLIIFFILMGLFVAISVISFVSPIYNLTNSQ